MTTSQKRRRYDALPYAFTEQGVAMLPRRNNRRRVTAEPLFTNHFTLRAPCSTSECLALCLLSLHIDPNQLPLILFLEIL